MKLLAAIFCLGSVLRGDDCALSHLNEKETLARFQQLDRAAQAAFDAGRYTVAAQQYREAACLVPKSARAFYGLGIAEAAAGNFPAARKALDTAYTILPENALPLAMLVRVDVALNDTEEAKTVLRTSAQRFPKDAELHAGLARFLAENQMLDLALAESLRSEQTGAGDPASAVALAALENTVGAYEDAIRNGEAVEKDAGIAASVRASAAGVAGLSYESTGRREQAIQHLREAIRLAPAQENSYLALAFLYQKAKRFKEAVEILEQGRNQIPESPNFLLPLGNNLVWAEQYPAGIDVLNELIAKAPGTAEAYVRLAEAYRNTGRGELEVDALRRLARVQRDYPMLHVLTARAMMSMSAVDYSGVLAELAEAAKAARDDPEIDYLQGKAYAGMGRTQDAVTALKRAIELNPLDPSPYYQLGLAYEELGQTELARQTLERMQHLKQTNR